MYALYDIISGKNGHGKAISPFPGRQEMLGSIYDHLQRLLNARQGVLRHLPDYGLPDLDTFYRDLPYSEESIADAVKLVIEKYEPRLSNVQVQPLPKDIGKCVVCMGISGCLPDGSQVSFQTLFKSNCQTQVTQPHGA